MLKQFRSLRKKCVVFIVLGFSLPVWVNTISGSVQSEPRPLFHSQIGASLSPENLHPDFRNSVEEAAEASWYLSDLEIDPLRPDDKKEIFEIASLATGEIKRRMPDLFIEKNYEGYGKGIITDHNLFNFIKNEMSKTINSFIFNPGNLNTKYKIDAYNKFMDNVLDSIVSLVEEKYLTGEIFEEKIQNGVILKDLTLKITLQDAMHEAFDFDLESSWSGKKQAPTDKTKKEPQNIYIRRWDHLDHDGILISYHGNKPLIDVKRFLEAFDYWYLLLDGRLDRIEIGKEAGLRIEFKDRTLFVPEVFIDNQNITEDNNIFPNLLSPERFVLELAQRPVLIYLIHEIFHSSGKMERLIRESFRLPDTLSAGEYGIFEEGFTRTLDQWWHLRLEAIDPMDASLTVESGLRQLAALTKNPKTKITAARRSLELHNKFVRSGIQEALNFMNGRRRDGNPLPPKYAEYAVQLSSEEKTRVASLLEEKLLGPEGLRNMLEIYYEITEADFDTTPEYSSESSTAQHKPFYLAA